MMVMLKDKLRKESGALAKARAIRSSARKLNLVAASIRGKPAQAALTQLNFERRRIAREVKKVLQAAVANAENNHGLDVDKLYVAEAWVGRSFVMKRFHARGRGKSSGIEKPFSNLTIVVRERANEGVKKTEEENPKVAKSKTSAAPKPKAKKAPAKALAAGA
jgi:large subunit ribosomal protein L22